MQQRRVFFVLVALLIATGVAGLTAAAAASQSPTADEQLTLQPSTADDHLLTVDDHIILQTQPDSVVAQQEEIDADDIRITLTLTEDGAAEWAVSFRSVLDTDDRRDAFEELQADIESDPESYTAPFADRIDDTVATASETTDREMAAESFSIETERQSLAREYGVVTYRFTWQGFADIQGDELHAGDAISGFFLDEDTQLRIEWPESYELRSVEPVPTTEHTTAVSWDGSQTDFGAGEPRVVVGPAGLPLGLIAGGILLAVLIAGGWLWWRRQSTDGDTQSRPPADADSAAADTTAESASGAAGPEAAGATGTDGETEAAGAAGAAGASETTDNTPDPSLMSNEEQVLQLLDENGGRIKQKQVVDELGWTDAKTSKVVSGLREEGTIESFRIGRENVLTYPETDLSDT